jgi:ribokinase
VVCDGTYRYLEDVPGPTLVTADDVRAASALLAGADAVIVQLEQPGAAALTAVRAARGLVVLDGAPDSHRAELLAAADVVRADHREAEALTGRRITDPESAVRAGRALLGQGPSVVALEVSGEGNVVAWHDTVGGADNQTDAALVPLTGEDVVDTTGGGDAFVAALTVALVRGDHPEDATRLATAAAGRAVRHPGGRTELVGLD